MIHLCTLHRRHGVASVGSRAWARLHRCSSVYPTGSPPGTLREAAYASTSGDARCFMPGNPSTALAPLCWGKSPPHWLTACASTFHFSCPRCGRAPV